MKGFGHDHPQKCGMTQKFPFKFGSFEREKDQVSGRGVSRIVNVKTVSGMGSGDVMIALWSW